MTRVSSSAVAILLCLLRSAPLTLASTTTSIIDANGVFNTRAEIPQSSNNNNKGIVAIISSPGTKSFFDTGNGNENGGVTLTSSDDGGVSILSSSGATLSGTASLSRGKGAAAAASVAGSIILSGITESDLEYGLHGSRHEQTLSGIFKARLDSIVDTIGTKDTEGEEEEEEEEKTGEGEEGEGEESEEIKPVKLFLVMPPCDADADIIKEEVQTIFETALAEKQVSGVTFDELFEINIIDVENEEEANEVNGRVIFIYFSLEMYTCGLFPPPYPTPFN